MPSAPKWQGGDVPDPLLARRADYPILADCTYLISNSLGAMHSGTRDSLAAYAEQWGTRGVTAWPDWFDDVKRIADLVGAVVGAEPGSTIMQANVADAINAVVSTLAPGGSRRRIVTSAGDWPGTNYMWREWVSRHGGEVVVVPLGSDGITVDAQQIADEVDERTLAVSVSVVQFRTSALLDLDPVVEAAHRHGALLIADGYQAAGAVPIDLAARGIDVCVGGSVKWLCGGPGNGWLSVRPELTEAMKPTAVGWISHAHPFDFTFDDIEYAAGITRFAGGTPNIPAALAAEPAYAAVVEAGIAAIRARSISLTQPIVEAALERGLTVNSPLDPAKRGGHVTIDPAPGDVPATQAVCDELIRRGVIVDHRPGSGIRVAPHFYNEVGEA